MKETLTVKENREICFSDGEHISNCILGVTGEKNATILKFVKPLKINDEPAENFKMRAVFNNEAGSFPVEVDSDELALGPEITAFPKSILCVQFLKNNEIKWSSFPAKVYFIKGADDSGENVVEKAKSEQKEADRTELGETLSDLTGQDLKKSDWDELIDIANELPLKTEQNVLDLTNYSALTNAFEHAKTAPSLLTGGYKLDKEDPDDSESAEVLIKLPYLNTKSVTNFGNQTPISNEVEECSFDISSSPDANARYNFGMFQRGRAKLTKLGLTGVEHINSLSNMFINSPVLNEIALYVKDGFLVPTEVYRATFYSDAFNGCRKLKNIVGDPLDMSVTSNYGGMFKYCQSLRYVRFKPRTINGDLDLSDCPALIKGKYEASSDDPGTLISILNGVRDYSAEMNQITIKFSIFVKDYLTSWRCEQDPETGLYVAAKVGPTIATVLTNEKGVVIA